MKRFALAMAAVVAMICGSAHAEEGMWTFDNFPTAKVKAALGVDIDKAWLDRVQASAVRLTSGCSASIVSANGLVLTNHHCVRDCVQTMSSAKVDYVKLGYLIDARKDEKTCPGMQAEVLISSTDITAQVQAAVRGVAPDGFVKARDAALTAAEKAVCGDDKTLRCQALSFYGGGQFKVYKYHKYSDVRLVFAPESSTAFFGGDPDNFNFPRYDLDCGFLRLYENGQPVSTPQHLTWSTAAPKTGEPVFVAGNPGGTERLLTVSQLETLRNLTIPVGQLQRSEQRGRLLQFASESPEHNRIAQDTLFGNENSFKVYFGRQFVLNDAAFMAAKRADEAALRAKVKADPALAARIGDPWSDLEKVQLAYADRFLTYRQLESNAGGGSQLYKYAVTLVRAAQDRTKPTAERLPEYADTRLPLVEKDLLDARPVDAPIEVLGLAFWLSKTREYLTTDAPSVKALLGKESPEALAARLVKGSKLADPKVREALWKGGLPAIQASTDPLIQFVLKTDAAARAARTDWNQNVSGPTERASAKVGEARFAVFGDSVYPDANFSLRISYGRIQGWTYRGVTVPATTNIGGAYERATGADPFELAPRWIAAKSKLNLDTVFDVSSTNDIIGGNSGSPLINAKGEVIGAVFDGNIHSLGGDYGYDGTLNRSVSASTAAITEALNKVYGRTALVAELTGR